VRTAETAAATARNQFNSVVDRGLLMRNPCHVRRDLAPVPLPLVCVAALAAAAGACLPAGPPPAGQHVIEGRTLTGACFAPSEKLDVPASLLTTGPLRGPGLSAPFADEVVADLYLVPEGAPSAAPADLMDLVPTVIDMEIPGGDPTSHTLATDGTGRLLYLALDPMAPAPAVPFVLRRFDPAAGAAQTLAAVDPLGPLFANPDARLGMRPFLLSPGRTQLYAGSAQEGRLWGPTLTQPLYQPGDVAFVGEDFVAVGMLSPPDPNLLLPSHDLLRIKPDAPPEVLLSTTAALGFAPVFGGAVPQLMLELGTATGAAPFALLDTERLTSTSLPAEKGFADFVSASPDGQFMVFRTALVPSVPASEVSYRLFIFDLVTQAYAFVDASAVGKDIGATTEWRPATDELWFQTLPAGFGTWSPDTGTRFHAATLASYERPRAPASIFTQDGRHWFSRVDGAPPAWFVGQTDAPDAPGLRLNPPGTQTRRHLELADGRLLVEAWTSAPARSDIYLVDADAGVVRPIGSAGHVAEVGRARALALLDWQLTRASGQLALLDFATGGRTVLAEDVYAVAVDRGFSAALAGEDPLAAGTRVAFLTRNRLEAPDDGLWVAVLP
jgi:hypothetical protein